MENNKIEYKWNKLFASMRFDTDEGIISLTPEEQQELIDDISSLRELKSDLLNPVIETCIHTRCNNFQSKGSLLCSNHIKKYSR